MKIKKEIRALYLKKIGIDWENKKLCGYDQCNGICVGLKFTAMDMFYAQNFERKYGVKNGKK